MTGKGGWIRVPLCGRHQQHQSCETTSPIALEPKRTALRVVDLLYFSLWDCNRCRYWSRGRGGYIVFSVWDRVTIRCRSCLCAHFWSSSPSRSLSTTTQTSPFGASGTTEWRQSNYNCVYVVLFCIVCFFLKLIAVCAKLQVTLIHCSFRFVPPPL